MVPPLPTSASGEGLLPHPVSHPSIQPGETRESLARVNADRLRSSRRTDSTRDNQNIISTLGIMCTSCMPVKMLDIMRTSPKILVGTISSYLMNLLDSVR
jgi:hypothetical protein